MCVAALAFLSRLACRAERDVDPAGVLALGARARGRRRRARRGTAGIDSAPSLRRAVAVVLVFHYVCLAWIFFRATSFDNALAILRQLAALEIDHANLVPLVTVALVVGFVVSLLRRRQLPLAARPVHRAARVGAGPRRSRARALVLRELAHTKIVPFIYFQF